MPKRKDTLLTVLHRFTRKLPGAWEKTEATFNLARALRQAQRGNAEPVNETGLFIDIVDAAQGELLRVARIVSESPEQMASIHVRATGHTRWRSRRMKSDHEDG